ncbi:MAG: hypothetical protein DME43_11020 [Verrucomicrobia bacterium]|nr:MAG: hypothetical protein DME43_11020 [Verrucomicrobiota bacterium]
MWDSSSICPDEIFKRGCGGFTFVFSTGMVLPLYAADSLSDSERLQNLEKATDRIFQQPRVPQRAMHV